MGHASAASWVTERAPLKCEVLLAAEGLDAAPRRLVEAAVRYFVLSDDGAWDFTANGLDDDLAVLRAVAARVGVVAGAPP